MSSLEQKALSIRISMEEYEQLSLLAEQQGESPTALARTLILNGIAAPQEQPTQPPQPEQQTEQPTEQEERQAPSDGKDRIALKIGPKGVQLIKERAKHGESPMDAAKRIFAEGVKFVLPLRVEELADPELRGFVFHFNRAKARLEHRLQSTMALARSSQWQTNQEIFRRQEAERRAVEATEEITEKVGGAVLDVPVSSTLLEDLKRIATTQGLPVERLASALLGLPVTELWEAEQPQPASPQDFPEPTKGNKATWPQDWPKDAISVAFELETIERLRDLAEARGSLCGSLASQILERQVSLYWGKQREKETQPYKPVRLSFKKGAAKS